MPEVFRFNDLGSAELGAPAPENLQSNILRSTDRPRSTQVFRRFGSADALRVWLRGAATPPTPASENPAGPIATLLFSAQALAWLGVAVDSMDEAFLRGSRHVNTLRKLSDGDTAGWGPHRLPWHVVELHAHDEDGQINVLPGGDYVVEHGSGYKQDGSKVSARGEHSYGHFKILDGISQLFYTQADYDEHLKQNGPPRVWDPRQKLSTLLVPDPVANQPDTYGSYFVFRKLEQDAALFEARVEAIAKEIEQRRSKQPDIRGTLTPEQRFGFDFGTGDVLRTNIKRWIFGRAPDGTRFGPDGKPLGQVDNDFDYKNDPEGARCPFHAHIRKVTPRGDTGDLAAERRRTLARRGTSYYKTEEFSGGVKQAELANKGLLFWCAQASIREQFEYVQEKWANASNVDLALDPTPDVDTVIGRLDAAASAAPHWKRWTTTSNIDHNIWESVVLTGADYLYAPSIPACTNLLGGRRA